MACGSRRKFGLRTLHIGRLDESIAVAGAQNPRALAVNAFTEQVGDALVDALDPVDPCQQPGRLQRLEGLGRTAAVTLPAISEIGR